MRWEALKGIDVTESGQEPPHKGRGSADASGGSAQKAGRRRSKNRRRRRGSAKTGNGAAGPPVANPASGTQPDLPSGAAEGNGFAAGTQPGSDASAATMHPGRKGGSKPQRAGPAPGRHISNRGRIDRSAGSSGPDGRSEVSKARQQQDHSDGHRADNQSTARGRSLESAAPRNGHRQGNGSAAGKQLYAALDLGTNNCRLLIARPEERGFRVVDAYSRIVRLGEGVDASRRLSTNAMDRAIEALANCNKKLQDRGVNRARLIATEACRAADNGTDFIDRVHRETGLSLEIVDRETEARLAVAGCVSLVDRDAHGVILFDIGGGSSEIVWLDLRNRCGARGYALTRFIRSWISLPIGVVNLAERHGGMHVTPEIFEDMVEDATGHLAAFSLAGDLAEAIASGGVHMLGTSGTVTTLAGVHLGLKRYDRRRVDGTWLDNDKVGKMIDRLRDMPYEERVSNPCIGADRADLVLAGCAILEAIRRRWTCSRLRVADRGLREGILTEMMAADGAWSRRKHSGRKRYFRNRGRE